MNTAFDQIITASDNDRGALFVETAARLGTAALALQPLATEEPQEGLELHICIPRQVR